MCGVRDSGGRDGQYGRGGRGIGRSQIIINGVDVLDQTLNFTADEWNILGWNGGRSHVSHEREQMNGRGHGGQCGVRYGVRGYGSGGGPRNVHEFNTNKGGGNNEGQKKSQGNVQGGKVQGKGYGDRNGVDKGGQKDTGFGRGAYI